MSAGTKAPLTTGSKRNASLLEAAPQSRSLDHDLQSQHRGHEPVRKRARVACTWCRDRKVRCDVSSHGIPCTNCELDNQDCGLQSVQQRKLNADHPTRENTYGCNQRPSASSAATEPSIFRSASFKQGGSSNLSLISGAFLPTSIPSTYGGQGSSSIWQSMRNNERSSTPNVIFSYYPFLKLPGLRSILSEDLRYLNAKGCLHVPGREALDEFMRNYFLYVHPCLPLLDEADFWRIYRNRQFSSGKEKSISLFTFQAMLFASCSFVPTATIKAAGFSDARSARNSLYTRAKLLFDLKCEKEPLSCAQGAILLTYQSSTVDLHAGSLWLSIAIENAMIYGAHRIESDDAALQNDPHRNTRKRVWWSILIRDRILPLGLRRHLQITPRTFDLSLDPMTEADLQDEIYNSEVYDPDTKRLLAKVLRVQCELCMVLTNVVMLVYAPKAFGHPPVTEEDDLPNTIRQVDEGRRALEDWSNNAKAALGPAINTERTHESVALYFGLTFLYYHAARLALCQFEALTLSVHRLQLQDPHEPPFVRIQSELEDGIGCIDDTMRRFLARGLVHHLPISTIAYTALPLLLNALDIKLSTSRSQTATRKRRFRHYANVMQLYQDRYDGTDSVAAFIQKALEFAGSLITPKPHESHSHNRKPSTSDSWPEVFSRSPQLYLCISLALDYAFTCGHFPEETELTSLIGIFTPNQPVQPQSFAEWQGQEQGQSQSQPRETSITSFSDLLESASDDYADGPEEQEPPKLLPATQTSPASLAAILNAPDSPPARFGDQSGSFYTFPFTPFSHHEELSHVVLNESPKDECHTFFNFESPGPGLEGDSGPSLEEESGGMEGGDGGCSGDVGNVLSPTDSK